ncbi:MAG TPA: hypothetical protein VGR21_10640 [Cryptosporangiaceae bacterium]|nr:hypothetical protein [Cryptosporangiaceae bacterium]
MVLGHVGAGSRDACQPPGGKLADEAFGVPEREEAVVVGPAVLGWAAWREIGQRYGLGLTAAAVRNAMRAGAIPVQPVAPLAHVLVGALDEAALYLARAEDPPRARQEISAVIRRLVYALASDAD